MTDQELSQIYSRMSELQQAAKQRRIATGQARFTDLDEEGVRAYKRQKQAERRARMKARAETLGHRPLDAEGAKDALLDALLQMIAAGDERVAPVLGQAAKSFRESEGQALSVFVKIASRHAKRKAAQKE